MIKYRSQLHFCLNWYLLSWIWVFSCTGSPLKVQHKLRCLSLFLPFWWPRIYDPITVFSQTNRVLSNLICAGYKIDTTFWICIESSLYHSSLTAIFFRGFMIPNQIKLFWGSTLLVQYDICQSQIISLTWRVKILLHMIHSYCKLIGDECFTRYFLPFASYCVLSRHNFFFWRSHVMQLLSRQTFFILITGISLLDFCSLSF